MTSVWVLMDDPDGDIFVVKESRLGKAKEKLVKQLLQEEEKARRTPDLARTEAYVNGLAAFQRIVIE